MNTTAMRGADNKVTGVIGVLHDITDIKMAAEQKDIADDLARLIRSANAPIFGVNRAGEVTEWNDSAAAMVGFTREEALGKSLVDSFVRQEDAECVRRIIADACSGVESSQFEFPVIHRDGSEVLVLHNAATRKTPAARSSEWSAWART